MLSAAIGVPCSVSTWPAASVIGRASPLGTTAAWSGEVDGRGDGKDAVRVGTVLAEAAAEDPRGKERIVALVAAGHIGAGATAGRLHGGTASPLLVTAALVPTVRSIPPVALSCAGGLLRRTTLSEPLAITSLFAKTPHAQRQPRLAWPMCAIAMLLITDGSAANFLGAIV